MKKTLLIIISLLFTSTLFAQKMTEIKTSDLPKATTDYIATNMPGSTLFKAAKVEENGTFTYNVAVDIKGRKHILVFDKDGKFLKKGDNMVQEQKSNPNTDPKNAPKPPAKAPTSEQAPKK